MQDINELLSGMLKESGADILISSPSDINKLREKGLRLEGPIRLTNIEYIDKLFDQRKADALKLLENIPPIPNVPIPIISFLYKEIAECVLFGLYGAAITLSAILVEYVLKYAIIKNKTGNNYDAKEWDRIENIELGPVIDEAKELCIIDEAMKNNLVKFKNKIRNPYLHYNIKRITKGVKALKVKRFNIETQMADEVDLDAEKDPILWPHAKKIVDKHHIWNVLDFACNLVALLKSQNP